MLYSQVWFIFLQRFEGYMIFGPHEKRKRVFTDDCLSSQLMKTFMFGFSWSLVLLYDLIIYIPDLRLILRMWSFRVGERRVKRKEWSGKGEEVGGREWERAVLPLGSPIQSDIKFTCLATKNLANCSRGWTFVDDFFHRKIIYSTTFINTWQYRQFLM